MMQPDATNRATLANSAYSDDKNLSARQALYEAQVPQYDLPGIVLKNTPASARVLLDVGCGNGRFVKALREHRPEATVVGADVSPGILAPIAPPVLVADAEHLPVWDHSVDVLLEMHMLYHVNDIDAALWEARRSLRPGGTLIVSTNSRSDKHELGELWSSAAADVLGATEGPERVSLSDRFALEDAQGVLGRYFAIDRAVELPGKIVVRDPQVLVAYFESYRAWAGESGVPFNETIERVAHRAEDAISNSGGLNITCRSGILICSSEL